MKKDNIYKALWFIVIAVLLILILVGCKNSTTATSDNCDDINDSGDRYVVEITKDKYNNVIQKTIYDTSLGYTYLYSFNYISGSDWKTIVSDSKLIILDANGNIKLY